MTQSDVCIFTYLLDVDECLDWFIALQRQVIIPYIVSWGVLLLFLGSAVYVEYVSDIVDIARYSLAYTGYTLAGCIFGLICQEIQDQFVILCEFRYIAHELEGIHRDALMPPLDNTLVDDACVQYVVRCGLTTAVKHLERAQQKIADLSTVQLVWWVHARFSA